jgi:hypothetical protein
VPEDDLGVAEEGGFLVRFLVYPPDDLVLVVKDPVARRLATFGSPRRPYATGRGHALIGRKAVTFCSWHPPVVGSNSTRPT